jgi:glutaconate CoA-transferase subunit B
LPGSGGACEISILAKRVLVIAPQSMLGFPDRVDFITSPGFVDGAETRRKLGMPGGGPAMVITNLGCYVS